MLYQPTDIIPDEMNGHAAADADSGLDISWRVRGSSAMTAYRIDIYENDAASTLVYSTGTVTLTEPFWGTAADGTARRFSVSVPPAALAAAGIVNGGEYKLLITLFSSPSDSVTQLAASVFRTRTAPNLVLTDFPATVTTKAHTFTASYSQAEGDCIASLRWRMTVAGHEGAPFLDTGAITGTGELSCAYDGFLPGTDYSVQLTVTTESGVTASTGWRGFSVSYALPQGPELISARWLEDEGCVRLEWEQQRTVASYSVFRRLTGDGLMRRLAELPPYASGMKDYSVRSGGRYTYYVFPAGPGAYVSEPMASGEISVRLRFWEIIEASPNADGTYTVLAVHAFRYGRGGVSQGMLSNNNTPSIRPNFTRYPTRQASSADYLSGTLGAYAGTVDYTGGAPAYSDSVSDAERLTALSVTSNALFLCDPKGRLLRVGTSGPITIATDTGSGAMPQTVTVPWVETGDASGVSLVSAFGEPFTVEDRIIFTAVSLDIPSGMLTWLRPDDYTGGQVLLMQGADLYADNAGVQDPASLGIDANGNLVAAL